MKGSSVSKGFFGCRIWPLLNRIEREPKEIVGSGNNILKLRTVLGLKERNCINQDTLVRNELPGYFQLRQGTAGFDAFS